MKFKFFVVFVCLVCCLLPGMSLAQDKVVVIPLDSGNCDCNEIPTVTSAGGRVWMDRNLGAYRVAQSIDDYRAYGWMYQWGRLADGHELRSSPTTTTISIGDVPGHGDFITNSSSPFDWRDGQNDNLWQGVSGTNNPCPAGFRLPTETEWEAEIASWSSNNAAGAFASPLKLVAAGFRSNSDGAFSGVGINGYYWSSTVISRNACYMHTNLSDAYTYNSNRSRGYNVRCIKD
ncbi:hypothetical protein DSCA_62970 [Desulfosarcina alkanivorans]|uniref:Uncharacterized protein n=1 Tax=Desulfosarcina alkanivorans TaxID=571177 RepID=A0A5K7Z775_9BACT|nr:FISUMP domain-containing protein [Desulfosarcina alkanivorans]BBO72367.1 hypothetical protein DSCA_62970 [Desulfosarcina alkanivorans]